MQLQLRGSTKIRAKRTRVYELLTDPEFIASSLPDAEEARVMEQDSVEAKIKVKVSLVSSTLKVRLRIGEKRPPSHAALFVEGAGGGSSLKIMTTFDLEGDGETVMSWTADAEVGGLMAGLGSTLLRGFSEKKVGEIFQGITAAVEAKA